MARDKNGYLAKVSKGGSRPETRNQEIIVEVLVDLLDVMDDVLSKLGDIEEAIKGT